MWRMGLLFQESHKINFLQRKKTRDFIFAFLFFNLRYSESASTVRPIPVLTVRVF